MGFKFFNLNQCSFVKLLHRFNGEYMTFCIAGHELYEHFGDSIYTENLNGLTKTNQ